MSRTTKGLAGAALALALAAGTQVAVYHHNASPTTTLHASWAFTPKSSAELRSHAKSIVLARVVSVSDGPDIVTKHAEEPGGADRIPTQRITVEVLKSYKGAAAAGNRLTLFQTGGRTQSSLPAGTKGATSHVQRVVLDGDPAYRAGEQYLLMLEAGPQGTLRPVSPEGRYRYNGSNGTLTALADNAVAKQLASQRLTTLESTLRAGS